MPRRSKRVEGTGLTICVLIAPIFFTCYTHARLYKSSRARGGFSPKGDFGFESHGDPHY